MASITIRNLDETVMRRLRIRAAEHGRSMEEEAREILRLDVGELVAGELVAGELVAGELAPPANLGAAIRARVAACGGADIALPPRLSVPE